MQHTHPQINTALSCPPHPISSYDSINLYAVAFTNSAPKKVIWQPTNTGVIPISPHTAHDVTIRTKTLITPSSTVLKEARPDSNSYQNSGQSKTSSYHPQQQTKWFNTYEQPKLAFLQKCPAGFLSPHLPNRTSYLRWLQIVHWIFLSYLL
jgi:hypothetical protein